ncbi:MAG: hypothetical protein AAB263_17400 [Planctomycetota bacterium]
MNAGLIIAGDLASDPQCAAVIEQLRLRKAPCVVLQQAVSAKLLLATLRSLAVDPARSWLTTRDPAAIAAASTAGMLGVVVVGSGIDSEDTVLVRHVPDLVSVPIAMVPRGGGCWHDAG